MRDVTVLILPPDPFSVTSIRNCVELVHPGAICLIATSIQQARLLALARNIDLLIIGLDAPDGDRLDFLFACAQPPKRILKTMVLTARNAPRLLISLRSLKVDGVFDSTVGTTDNFEKALRMLDSNLSAWSEVFLAGLYTEQGRIVRHQLTPREHLALAIIGDGCGDRLAANRLGMEHSSVRSMRCDIYSKLGAHGADDIVRLGAQLGYTRYSSGGVTALGLSVLIREYETLSRRPSQLPDALLVSCGMTRNIVAA